MKFRDLRADEIDVRVGQVGDGWATLLLYKDARVDMDILDETVGPLGWQRKHYELKGNIYCSVGIVRVAKDESNFIWAWKDDCGTESNTEPEKGESSDSFKRACVNWGIGRELYTCPKIFIKCETEAKKIKGNPRFEVEKIKIENKKITGLSIQKVVKGQKERVFVWTAPGESQK